MSNTLLSIPEQEGAVVTVVDSPRVLPNSADAPVQTNGQHHEPMTLESDKNGVSHPEQIASTTGGLIQIEDSDLDSLEEFSSIILLGVAIECLADSRSSNGNHPPRLGQGDPKKQSRN